MTPPELLFPHPSERENERKGDEPSATVSMLDGNADFARRL
jgi:hypothetical protein